jgi:hypothetical protein
MRFYAAMDDTGTYPLVVYTTNIAGRPVPQGMIDAPNLVEGMMLTGGQWVARPALADPVLTGNVVRFENIPEGTFCEVLDLGYQFIAGQIEATNGIIEFQIADAGTYQLEVSAPLPWLSKTINVVIA